MINGTWEHLLMGLASTLVSIKLHKSIFPAVVMMVTVELVQIDILGIEGRIVDTLHDLGMDTVGLILTKLILK